MQSGDLGSWDVQHVVVVLEGVLAHPTWHDMKVVRARVLRKKQILMPANTWSWSPISLKTLVRYHQNDVLVDVVTFHSEAVADAAAEWLLHRDVPYSACEFVDYEVFAESLSWRPYVSRVIDSDHNRLVHYGARAYETTWGGEF